MNFELKKINWEPGKAPSQTQLMTLRIRKKSDEDDESYYTTITDALQVHADGTILNPPIINDLQEETNYVLRVLNNDPAGGKFDMVFTTPGTFETEPFTPSYYPNSEVMYTADSNIRGAMLPPQSGAYYSLDYTAADWFETYNDAILSVDAVFEKKQDMAGIKLQTPSDYVIFAMDAGFLEGIKTQYALGLHFYVDAKDLPATGRWPLISFGAPPDRDGVSVYVNCETKKVHWAQQRNVTIQEIVSTEPIKLGEWNQVLVSRPADISASKMWLNTSDTSTGTFTTATIPNIIWMLDSVSIGSPGGIFSKYYYTTLNMDSLIAEKYLRPPYPVGILEDYYDAENKFTIPTKNLVIIDKNYALCSLPTDTPSGRKWFYLEDSLGKRRRIEVNVLPLEKVQYPIEMDFSPEGGGEYYFKDLYYPMATGWGGANGGVSEKHIYTQNGQLVFEAHGDQYNGTSRGYRKGGGAQYHNDQRDPSFGLPWTTRVGAMIKSKDYYGYGRYVVEAKLPRDIGVAPSFWTSFYGKVYPRDPRYDQILANGLHRQGDLQLGYYVVEDNQINMDLPSNNASYIFYNVEEMLATHYHMTWEGQLVAVEEDADPANNGTWKLNNTAAPELLESWTKVNNEIQHVHQPQKDNIICTNRQGEIGEGRGLITYNNPFEDEFFSMLTNIGKDVWDGEFHEFRFDWYADRVEYYVDGEMIQVNKHFVPDIAGRWSIGLWFPSEPEPQRSWRTDIRTAWAGPVADWKYQKMFIKRIAHTPFTDEEAGGSNRLVGENEPFDGLRRYPAPLPA